jgi:hypothetical protein
MTRKKKHQYKSEAEYQAAEQLHKFKVKFEYEPYKIEYEWREDKKYIPDFVLPNGVVLEVKGRFMLEDRKKHLFIKKQHPYGFRWCKLSDGIPEEWLDNQYETD